MVGKDRIGEKQQTKLVRRDENKGGINEKRVLERNNKLFKEENQVEKGKRYEKKRSENPR